MGARLVGSLIAVALLIAAFAGTASAQQVSPGGPDAQVSEYVLEETEIGGGPEQTPSIGGPGETNEVGVSKGLPFTGLWLLPLAALGLTLAFVGVAMRRRRTATPASL